MKRWLVLALGLICGIAASGQEVRRALEIAPLADGFYVFTTYNTVDGSLFPSNGLICLTQEGAVLIDTPWDTTQFQPLLDSIWSRHHQRVVATVSTHWHDDRTACTERFEKMGARTYSRIQTQDLCRANDNEVPAHGFLKDTTFHIGGLEFEAFYPGAGHAQDNIVVWFPKSRILYGGCLVKSVQSKGLGFTGDADLAHWPDAIRAVQQRYPQARWVIPGHQAWKGKEALSHTLKLLKAAK